MSLNILIQKYWVKLMSIFSHLWILKVILECLERARHIIDFIVEIVNPQKHESILDPACGTAGFLISSYKHILKTNTDKKLGDQLSSEDRKKVGKNLNGYDIEPQMVRLSLVNMFLHGFSTPKYRRI